MRVAWVEISRLVGFERAACEGLKTNKAISRAGRCMTVIGGGLIRDNITHLEGHLGEERAGGWGWGGSLPGEEKRSGGARSRGGGRGEGVAHNHTLCVPIIPPANTALARFHHESAMK